MLQDIISEDNVLTRTIKAFISKTAKSILRDNYLFINNMLIMAALDIYRVQFALSPKW